MTKCDCCRSTPCSEGCTFYPEGAEWIRGSGPAGWYPDGTLGWQRREPEPEPEPPSPPKQSGVHADVGNYRVVVIDDDDKPDILSRAVQRTKAAVMSSRSGMSAKGLVVKKDCIVLSSDLLGAAPGSGRSESRYIPADVLATALRFAGWKVKRPGEV